MLTTLAADRIDTLVDRLVVELAAPGLDPFEPAWIAVPSIGMRRWLTQELSSRVGTTPGSTDGIAANVHLPFPSALRHAVLAADPDRPGDDDPWQIDRLQWAVLAELADPGDPLLAPLQDLPPGATRAGRARRLADLLDRYGVHRPEMVQQWATGHDVAADGRPLAPDRAWQPALFRAVRRRLGRPSPAERLATLLPAVRSGELVLPLPRRLTLFGLTAFPAGLGPVLDALSGAHDVLVLHLALSAPLTRQLLTSAPGIAGGQPPARDDRDLGHARHPLLRSWARPNRELALLLGSRSGNLVDTGDPEAPRSLLEQVQADIRANREPAGTFPLSGDDRSVQVHAAAGPSRQVEILRDAILHALAADAALTEAEILVVCPRVEVFRPLLEAAFGAPVDAAGPTPTGPPALRYRVTDRSLRDRDPQLAALASLLELATSRCTATDVASFLAASPVRERFGLGTDDLALLDRWIDDAGVRWGIDAEHRSAWGVPAALRTNTWEAGLDRVLLGVAVGEGPLRSGPGDTVPLAVDASDAAAAGRVAEAIRTTFWACDRLRADRPLADWLDVVAEVAARLFAPPREQRWGGRPVDRALGALEQQATDAGGVADDVELSLADLRKLLADRLQGEPMRSAFGTGALTVCGPTPLRSVPHRVVCVLGLDEEHVPRSHLDGDDVLADHPLVGDADRRGEFRQLVLEALLSASDRFIVTHSCIDTRTSKELPRSVLLDELLDCLVASVAPAEPARRRRDFVTRHPRQAFDPRNFRADGGLADGPWGFDPTALDGARALAARGATATSGVLVAAPLPLADEHAVALKDLHDLLHKPVRHFFRELEASLPGHEDQRDDLLSLALDGLEKYSLGDAWLQERLADPHADLERWLAVLQAGGRLPPGRVGRAEAEDLTDTVAELLEAAATIGAEGRSTLVRPVDVELPGGRRLLGTVRVPDAAARPGPALVRFARHKPSTTLRLWLDLLALTAADPEGTACGLLACRGVAGGKPPVTLRLTVQGDDADERRATALTALSGIVRLSDAARRQPVPLFDRTSYALHRGGHGARNHWERGDFCERVDDYHRLAFGDIGFSDLLGLSVAGRDPWQWAHELWNLFDRSVVEDDGPAASTNGPSAADGTAARP